MINYNQLGRLASSSHDDRLHSLMVAFHLQGGERPEEQSSLLASAYQRPLWTIARHLALGLRRSHHPCHL